MTFTFSPAPVRNVRKARSPFAIIRIAEQATPEVQKAFLKAVAAVRDATVSSRVREALERGDLRAAYNAIPWEEVGEKALRDSLPTSLRDVYERSANLTANRLSRDLELSIRFDVTNPRAVDYIRNHTGQLIREFGQSSQETVRYILDRSFREGIPPAKTARMLKETGIGLTTRQHIAVENMRRRLENDPDVDLSGAQIDARAERYANRLLRFRTMNIARTETIAASANGQHGLWQQARDEGLIDADTQRQWIAAEDERACEQCSDLDGELAPLEGFYPDGTFGPPAHPQCRCSERLVFREDASE